jgi:hypothetical protein
LKPLVCDLFGNKVVTHAISYDDIIPG